MAEDYEIPYYDQVANDPSFDEMKAVVYDKGIRPQVSNKWHSDDVSNDSYNSGTYNCNEGGGSSSIT